MLRSARKMAECVFNRLKGQWRGLLRPVNIPVKKMVNIINTCFVVHNFCEDAKREEEKILQNFVEKTVLEEQRAKLSKDKFNSHTSYTERKVREFIARCFKEYL